MDFNRLIVKDIETLTKKCEPFDFANPPFDPLEFAKHMIEVMYAHRGLGLSAIQLGYPLRVFVMQGNKDTGDYACFNPMIAMPSKEKILLDEGCLSFPKLSVKIKRARHIRCRFATPDGDVHTEIFKDMIARCFQHELDHCDGKLFFESASRLRLQLALEETEYEGKGLLKYAKG